MIEWTDWKGLYWKGWKGTVVEETFNHPAKFSRSLIAHIYQHLVVEMGWLKPGDAVIDLFAGVGLGALDAMYYGLHWHGRELEIHFVDTGQGCDCEGFSREDFRRYYRRVWRVNNSYGHHWCPGCVRAMEEPKKKAIGPGEPARGRRFVPEQGPHHYVGNIELWNQRYSRSMGGWGSAALVQGDSRYLVGPQAEASVSSPPYRGGGEHHDQLGGWNTNTKAQGRLGPEQAGYGNTPGQLAKMASGSVSSPPWGRGAEGGCREGKFKDPEAFAQEMSERDGHGSRHASTAESRAAQMERQAVSTYGDTSGNLGQMDASVSSPPYECSRVDTIRQRQAADLEVNLSMPESEKGYGNGGTGRERTNAARDTFWSAARMVVQNTYDLLASGGHAIWIVKDFVRGGQVVPFTEHWRMLCESVGFVTLHGHRCHLIEERGIQRSFLENGDVDKRRASKSFFRRLAEKKGSPAIDWEIVWCMVKP